MQRFPRARTRPSGCRRRSRHRSGSQAVKGEWFESREGSSRSRSARAFWRAGSDPLGDDRPLFLARRRLRKSRVGRTRCDDRLRTPTEKVSFGNYLYRGMDPLARSWPYCRAHSGQSRTSALVTVSSCVDACGHISPRVSSTDASLREERSRGHRSRTECKTTPFASPNYRAAST